MNCVPTKPHCADCRNRTCSIWSGLRASELRRLDKYKQETFVEARKTLFHQGDKCSGMYCVKDGLIAERRIEQGGRSALVRLHHPGSLLGYQELLGGKSYRNSAQAIEPTRLCFINRQTVKELVRTNPALCERFFQQSMADFEELENRYLNTKTMTMEARFLYALMDLYKSHGEFTKDNGFSINLPIARRDLGALIGSSPETISRIIRKVEQKGLIKFKGTRADIPDLEEVSRNLPVRWTYDRST